MRIRRIAFFLFSVALATADIAAAFNRPREMTLADYDANIAQALLGKFKIVDSLSKDADIGTGDKEITKAVLALQKYFSKECLAAFLEVEGKTLDIPRFQLLSFGTKGEGGFGKVFGLSIQPVGLLGGKKAQRYEIAVKMLKEVPTKNSDKYELEVEINNMKFLSSSQFSDGVPFAAPYHGSFKDKDGHIFILSKLLSEPLSKYAPEPGNSELATTPFSSAYLDRLIIHLGGALKKWADLNFVLNDFKPDNIMLDKEGNSLVIDLGTVRRLTGDQITNSNLRIDVLEDSPGSLIATVGSKVIQPPEKVLYDNSSLGPIDWRKSDVYSFGMTLLSLIAAESEVSLMKRCEVAKACSSQFLSGQMTENDFNGFMNFIGPILTEKFGEPRSVKAAKRLTKRLLTWKPADRPLDIFATYQEEMAK